MKAPRTARASSFNENTTIIEPSQIQAPKRKHKEAVKKDTAVTKQENDGMVGQRGKRRCPQCSNLVPIHSRICPECKNFEFKFKHKPKKIKEINLGNLIYSNPVINIINPLNEDEQALSAPTFGNKEFSIILDANKHYGLQDA